MEVPLRTVTSWRYKGVLTASEHKTSKGYSLYDTSEVERFIRARHGAAEADRLLRRMKLTLWGAGVTHDLLD